MRENASTKAKRYLVEGRVIVRYVNRHHVIAHVRGDGAVWRCQVYGESRTCDCPARGLCAHLLAVGLVTVVNRSGDR